MRSRHNRLSSKWNFLNVSYLTSDLLGYLDAPLPFFLGIPPHTWKLVSERKDVPVPADLLVYDVDNRTFVHDIAMPAFPEPEATVLVDTLSQLLCKKEAFTAVTHVTREKIVN